MKDNSLKKQILLLSLFSSLLVMILMLGACAKEEGSQGASGAAPYTWGRAWDPYKGPVGYASNGQPEDIPISPNYLVSGDKQKQYLSENFNAQTGWLVNSSLALNALGEVPFQFLLTIYFYINNTDPSQIQNFGNGGGPVRASAALHIKSGVNISCGLMPGQYNLDSTGPVNLVVSGGGSAYVSQTLTMVAYGPQDGVKPNNHPDMLELTLDLNGLNAQPAIPKRQDIYQTQYSHSLTGSLSIRKVKINGVESDCGLTINGFK